jgi:flagellar motor component MotA
MIIFPLVFMWILHGWKNIGSAFYIFCKNSTDKKELLNAKMFFENYCKTLFSIAFIGFIISFISMMYNLESKEVLGPRMAFASIMLLYAGIINMVIIMPYKIIINRKIMEIEN